eukprot:gb/GEZN01004280.1/.p1 GENE.gb/GEZN01004280.1/~~gb/GEZN01004280.1/.p1  ORF type:complete len:588 (+),score=100.41 gb/GEZN01004280.1/:213-1766(+)
MFLMTLLLVPVIRFLLVLFTFLLWFCLAKLSILFKKDMSAPHGPIRRLWTYPMRLMARLVLFWSGFYYIPVVYPPGQRGCCGFGKAKTARVMVANHIAIVDALTFIWLNGAIVAAKEPVFRVPILGTILSAMQFIAIDRRSEDSRRKSKEEMQRRMQDETCPPVLIFPEGTTSNPKVLTQFAGGAFSNGLAVQPVLLRYPNKHWDHAYCNGTPWTLWRTWCQLINFQTVQFMPKYQPNKEELADPYKYADNVQQLMAKELKVHHTSHTYQDVHLFFEAKKDKIDVSNFTIADFKEMATLSYSHLQELMENFKMLDTTKDGLLTLTEFGASPNLARFPPELVKKLYDIMDHKKEGKVGLREYMLGATAAKGTILAKDTLELAFQTYDVDKDGFVSRSDAKTAILKLSTRFQETDFLVALEALLDKIFPAENEKAQGKEGEGEATMTKKEPSDQNKEIAHAETQQGKGDGGKEDEETVKEVGSKEASTTVAQKKLDSAAFALAIKKHPDFIGYAFSGLQ